MKHEIKIIKRLSIKPIPMLIHKGEIWPHQNLMKPQSQEALERIMIEEKKNNKNFYAFFPLELGQVYRVYLDHVAVGPRLNHGNGGKRGFSFPESACQMHLTVKEAEDALKSLIEYFTDLAEGSLFGPKTKQAGQIQTNHFLFL